MWNFLKGDNLVENYDSVWTIYNVGRDENGNLNPDLIKPVVILLMAIVECILDDFVHRLNGRTNDPIQNITQEQLDDFKTKRRDQLEAYIAAAKKHNLFCVLVDSNLYDNLDMLRKARNRIHIQNRKNLLQEREHNVFTQTTLHTAELCFEEVVKSMMERYYRWGSPNKTPEDMIYPWQLISS